MTISAYRPDDIIEVATVEHVPPRRGRLKGLASKSYVIWYGLIGLVVIAAIFGSWIAPQDPTRIEAAARLLPPLSSSDAGFHLFGTDQLGRDVFSRVIGGARLTMGIALASTLIGGVIGVLAGVSAGYFGGRFDRFVMRSAEAQIALPNFLIAIFLLAILGPSLINLIIVLPMFVWPIYARLLRAEALVLKESAFIEAARATGCSAWRTVLRHMVPNMMPRILVLTVVEFGSTVLSEAMLSFLGIGVQPPDMTWGLQIAQGREYLAVAWWLVFFPGFALLLTVLSVNMISRRYAKNLGSAG